MWRGHGQVGQQWGGILWKTGWRSKLRGSLVKLTLILVLQLHVTANTHTYDAWSQENKVLLYCPFFSYKVGGGSFAEDGSVVSDMEPWAQACSCGLRHGVVGSGIETWAQAWRRGLRHGAMGSGMETWAQAWRRRLVSTDEFS